MKVGAALHIFWDEKTHTLDYATGLSTLSSIGFYSAEFLCDSEFYPGWATKKLMIETGKVKKTIDSLGIKATLHAPHYDFNIATNNVGLRAEMMTQVKDCLNVAEKLESEVLVLHPGRVSSKKFKREICIRNVVDFLSEIDGYARDKGVVICLENEALSGKSLCSLPKEMRYVIDEVSSKNVKICLDIAHINTTKNSLTEFLKFLKKDVYHIHISDNIGDSHHLPIGTGEINFKKTINEIKPYNKILNIEGWLTNNRDLSLRNSLKNLKELINEAKKA